jgi:hypothetical protein
MMLPYPILKWIDDHPGAFGLIAIAVCVGILAISCICS